MYNQAAVAITPHTIALPPVSPMKPPTSITSDATNSLQNKPELTFVHTLSIK